MRGAAIVILAAGSSSRLGRPKQLVQLEGQSLLRRAVGVALDASPSAVTVVLGARAEVVEPELQGLPVRVVHNERWELGMGSSITAGLLGGPVGVVTVLMVCDQPFVTADHLRALIALVTEQGGIAASSYDEDVGVPAAFEPRLLPELSALDPTHGAKSLIKRHRARTHAVAFPKGVHDVDTEADVALVQKLIRDV